MKGSIVLKYAASGHLRSFLARHLSRTSSSPAISTIHIKPVLPLTKKIEEHPTSLRSSRIQHHNIFTAISTRISITIMPVHIMTELEKLTRSLHDRYNLAMSGLDTPNHLAALRALSSLLQDSQLPHMLRLQSRIALAARYQSDWFLADKFRLDAEDTFRFIRNDLGIEVGDTRVPGQDEQLAELRWELDQVTERQRASDPRARVPGRPWPGPVAMLYSDKSAVPLREQALASVTRVYSSVGAAVAEEKALFVRAAPASLSGAGNADTTKPSSSRKRAAAGGQRGSAAKRAHSDDASVWGDFKRFVAEQSMPTEDGRGDGETESRAEEGQGANDGAKEENIGTSLVGSKKRKRETDELDSEFDSLAKSCRREIDEKDARMSGRLCARGSGEE